jgi:hypothetical protein
MTTGIVVYLFIKGFRRVVSGLVYVIMALTLACASTSLVIVAYSGGTVITIPLNATDILFNATDFTSYFASALNGSASSSYYYSSLGVS